ncbi:CAP domain containing protein [Trichuris trichiura]|uniref:CAP domain containing protein n=1 Tax=Trichuris trichiura TaxID=36087 RepID=A0A077Z0T8_TRITR|nr:CAP domain containing protein [Trichuris trichiura]
MECLTEWDKELEEKAQSNAVKCVDYVEDEEKGAAVIYLNSDSTSMDDYITQLDTMKQTYQYESNKCTSQDGKESTCKNYKQFVWWQGGKIGCSKSICRVPPSTSSSLLMCYFEKNFCQAGYDCVGDLCCVRAQPSTGSSCGVKPTRLVPLYRLVHKVRKDTVLTTSALRKAQLISTGYENMGTFGYISPSQENGCTRLKSLIEMKAKGRCDYVYVTGEEFLSYYAQKNYDFVSNVGYVVDIEDFCSANVTAYQFMRLGTYNYYTPSREEAMVLLTRAGTNSQYWFVNKPFALWETSE